MSKHSRFEQELIEVMQKNLAENKLKNKYSFDKISKAADYLNIAAEILDETGMHTEAEVLTKLLEKIANSKQESKARVDAMKRTGIPFLKNDANYSKDELSEIDSEIDLDFDLPGTIDVQDREEDPIFWNLEEPEDDED